MDIGEDRAAHSRARKMFEANAQSEGSIVAGLLAAAGLYLVQTLLVLFLVNSESAAWYRSLSLFFVAPPVTQLLYIIPFYLERRKCGKPSTASGLLGGACAMAIIHLICFGFVWLDMR